MLHPAPQFTNEDNETHRILYLKKSSYLFMAHQELIPNSQLYALNFKMLPRIQSSNWYQHLDKIETANTIQTIFYKFMSIFLKIQCCSIVTVILKTHEKIVEIIRERERHGGEGEKKLSILIKYLPKLFFD